jgi:hypothetical protein
MKQQWLQVKHVFSAALDHTDDSIAEFLDQQCGNDRELRAEVERLLKEHRSAGDFLEKPFLDREASRAQMSLPSSAAAAPGFFGTDRFILTRRLGAGAFGEVYEAFDSQRVEVP